MMIVDILLFLGGLLLLLFGATALVDGGASLAHRFNIPNAVIGLTIVAFGTSSPELVVSVVSATGGNSAIALGNVLGSNIFNILLILGVTSVICPLKVSRATTWVEVPLTLLSAIVLFLVVWNNSHGGFDVNSITRPEGFILLCFFAIFMAYTLHLAKTGGADEVEVKEMTLWKAIAFVIGGLAGLIIGGKMLVTGAVNMATAIGISERVIGLTIVAAGTSAPELATSIIAARKKNVDMAIGNIIGSNIFNAFLILGTTAVISPIATSKPILFDVVANIFASLLLFIFIFLGRGRQISRREGLLFIALYAVYLAVIW